MASKRIGAEELRTQSQIDILIGRIGRGEDLLGRIGEFDEPFRDLIRTIDAALKRPARVIRDRDVDPTKILGG